MLTLKQSVDDQARISAEAVVSIASNDCYTSGNKSLIVLNEARSLTLIDSSLVSSFFALKSGQTN